MPSVAYGTRTITYDIVRKPTLKNTYINVDRDGVLVKTNTATSEEEIEAFIVKKSDWILKHLQSYRQKAIETEIRTGSRIYYLGKSYYVELIGTQKRSIEVRFTHSRFVISAEKEVSQEALHRAIDSFYKEKAAVKIVALVEKWSKRMELTPAHISFRKANRRWGSCSATNRLSFNYRLMKLPTSLIEYVVVHELAHIRHKNHSPEFWSLVGSFMPDYREREKRIGVFEKLL
jgi:predicted metal-dependent hydrolase